MTSDLVFWGLVIASLLYSNRHWFFALRETTTITDEKGKVTVKKRRIQKPTKEQAELMELALAFMGKDFENKLNEFADKGLNVDSVLMLMNEAVYKSNQRIHVEQCYEYIRAKKHFGLKK